MTAEQRNALAEYNALPTTATPEEFLAGNGNWGLTEAESLKARELASIVVAAKPKGVRSLPYTGPFPRKRHSHYCKTCGDAVACYKSQCTRPQRTDVCTWCKPSLITTGGTQ